MSRAKPVLVNLSLVGVSMLLTLLLCEAAVRVLIPQQLATGSEGIWRPDSTLGWQHQEGADRVVNTGERPARFVSDDRGYRINAPDEYPTPGDPEFRILALGDSFVEGLMVDSEETAPKVLERFLTEDGMETEVVNSGVSGWSPYHYLLKAEQVVESESFDMGLVFLYVANDIIEPRDTLISVSHLGSTRRIRIPRSLSKSEVTKALLQPTNDALERRSHLFVLAKNRSEQLLARIGLTKYYFPDLFLREQARSSRWLFTTELAARIEDVFSRAQIPVLFVLLPAPYQVDEDVFYDYVSAFSIPVAQVDLEQPNRILSELFDEQIDASFVDVLGDLRERAEGSGPLYGRVDRHLNEDGHRSLAEAILPVVEGMLQPCDVDAPDACGDQRRPVSFNVAPPPQADGDR